VFAKALDAYRKQDVIAFRSILDQLGLFQLCVIVCRFFCYWNCFRICLILCKVI